MAVTETIAGSRILVIDSTALRKLVEIAMRGSGCEVDFAATGREGVMLARKHRPDVILADTEDACQRLSGDQATAGVPIVVMAADQRTKHVTTTELRSRLASAMREGSAVPPPTRRAQSSSLLPAIAHPRSVVELVAEGLARIARLPVPAGADPAAYQASQLCTTEWLADLATAMAPADSAADPRAAIAPHGDLAETAAVELLRALTSAGATGTLTVDLGSAIRVFLRRGEILMCTTTEFNVAAFGVALAPGMIVRARRDQATGKPAVITLAAAGLVHMSDVPMKIHACGARLLRELLEARSGAFAWQPASALPDFVEAFGSPLSVTAIALREEASRGIVVVDPDRDLFAGALRAHLARRAQPVDVIELEPGEGFAEHVLRLRPRAILLNTSLVTPQLVEDELPQILRDASIRLAAVLEVPDPIESAFARSCGVHLVLTKPIHVSDIERLLLG